MQALLLIILDLFEVLVSGTIAIVLTQDGIQKKYTFEEMLNQSEIHIFADWATWQQSTMLFIQTMSGFANFEYKNIGNFPWHCRNCIHAALWEMF